MRTGSFAGNARRASGSSSASSSRGEAATPSPDGVTSADNEVVAPELEKLQREVKKLNHSGGFLQISAEITSDEPEEPTLSEVNDMRRVDVSCHPDDPVKVLDD